MVALRLVVSTKVLINLALVVASLVVRVARVEVRVTKDLRSWAVADERLAMVSTISCWWAALG